MTGQWHLIADLADAGAALLFWVCALFPVIMATFWPWWQSWWGRNIVSLETALSVALLPSVLHREFGINTDTYFYGWAVVAALFAAAVIVIWRSVMIIRTQWSERKRGV